MSNGNERKNEVTSNEIAIFLAQLCIQHMEQCNNCEHKSAIAAAST